MFSLAHQHGDILREGWKNILDCLVTLFKAKLLPDDFVQVHTQYYVTPNMMAYVAFLHLMYVLSSNHEYRHYIYGPTCSSGFPSTYM